MPSISVIIPMYNAGKDIIRCLSSLERQTMQDFEILLLDDGSTDDSGEVVSRYLEKQPALRKKTRLIRKENEGVAETRNRGIALAEGTFVTFMDQDDFVAKDYLETYYRAITDGDMDMVTGGFLRVRSDGKIIKKKIVTEKPWSRYTLIVPWAHMYRRSFLLEKNIRFLTTKIGEDIPFTLTAYRSTDRCRIINYTGYRWFYNESSVSNSLHKTLDSRLNVRYLLDYLYAEMEKLDANQDDLIRYFYLRFICWYFLYSTRGSKRENIRNAYKDCFGWLKENIPDYRHAKYTGLRMPKGEDFSLHTFVFAFYLLEKLHLLRPMLLLFGK